MIVLWRIKMLRDVARRRARVIFLFFLIRSLLNAFGMPRFSGLSRGLEEIRYRVWKAPRAAAYRSRIRVGVGVGSWSCSF
jgi:hypothetical protein